MGALGTNWLKLILFWIYFLYIKANLQIIFPINFGILMCYMTFQMKRREFTYYLALI